ncbi:MAG TPA: metal-dependent hydrolase [Methylibium sp.]|uniref:metal-dependent hydrolase n=1 Tax=Methylibium sp. TaxID=2067992 RepID=UPI002DB5A087|nr:metal-dependent hydrolase [Methylibium sp.]HEU4460525.1 metal-dependent hydrolase [Methylibium sp.]
MDSVSQFVLGAACAVAVMGRRTAVWKAALAGGVAGTLPDLDVFIDHGDAIANMTMHRANSHSLFWLTLAAPLAGGLVAWLARQRALWRRWSVALGLALVTHPLLDAMTVYGTQLLQPFSEHPFAVGSIFIIDPLYTLPLLAGLIGELAVRAPRRALRWNAAGLLLSTAYLGWSVAAQQWAREQALAALPDRGAGRAVLVTPAPFNTLLWRVVAMRPDGYDEGYVSLLDRRAAGEPIRFVFQPTGTARLAPALDTLPSFQRMAWFSRGFYAVDERPSQRAGGAPRAVLSDLRMGQAPHFVFAFEIAERGADGRWQAVVARNIGGRGDLSTAWPWLWRRALGQPLPPPG